MAKSQPTGLSLSAAEDCLPPWMQTMRAAARAAVKQEDIEEIIRNQVKRAKEGDKKAIDFLFDQVLGGNELKGATFIQNVFEGGETPDRPSKALPGSEEKIQHMRRRIAAGNGAFHNGDGHGVDLS